ncbi:hypothetical protein AB0A98_06615 [Streptomyces chrestomyceticus]|uniref:hypothetical protein n=1 Tax=Streptomyces chrestomyceticus TaxID=68185 RepID=UPI0033E41FD4
MYKGVETSLRKSDRLGGCAAVCLVLNGSHLVKNYSTYDPVQRLSDRTLSLSAHLDDDGKVPANAASSPTECPPSGEAACYAPPKPWSTSHSVPTGAAPPSCTTPWGTYSYYRPDNSRLPIR